MTYLNKKERDKIIAKIQNMTNCELLRELEPLLSRYPNIYWSEYSIIYFKFYKKILQSELYKRLKK